MKIFISALLLFPGFFPVGVSSFTTTKNPRWEVPNPFTKKYRHSHGFTLNLFFKAREEESLQKKGESAQGKIPRDVLLSLSQEDLSLPFQFNLVRGEEVSSDQVTIRCLQEGDLDILVPMCVEEFGDSSVSFEDLFKEFPWQKPTQIQQHVQDWWDNFALPYFISFVFRLKLFLNEPNDYALIVATLRQKATTAPDLVGLVELSQQPPSGKKNPSAFPVPLWYKELYCSVNKLSKPNGWVTNLLVAPEFRGQGYSKLLMAAAEGMARKWGCNAIHLHCDANTVGGKVPQSLYTGLGYEMVEDKSSPYAWMGSAYANKIYMIEGVALLFFRKNLT